LKGLCSTLKASALLEKLHKSISYYAKNKKDRANWCSADISVVEGKASSDYLELDGIIGTTESLLRWIVNKWWTMCTMTNTNTIPSSVI